MRYYVSKTYEDFRGHYSRNVFLVLSDQERINLEDKIEQLIKDIELNPYGKKFNKKDKEAIVFLKRMCWFTTYPESQAIDPCKQQIDTIVFKLLRKVYNPFKAELINWLELYVDSRKMTAEEMKAHMNRKRGIAFKLKNEGLLPEDFVVGY